ncbi:hypothetical protein A7X95_02775 [Candidatus Nitrosopelagicus brevis]|jgi:hypothetical protein|uniref:Restriction endonuclease n=1 Tax=Candidatus Nitrosopelagicus brevis TaxID=1410606 RepID=A0A0A7UYQ9_9ARCH|nr:restriction endonuclease [Candidatus Nitrosopelagicus brevis]AJA91949.1 restriction endonuclease [Candidatus Nitrosopelagicus brevis]PTL88206.1 hypothetical protein A7X95_02775 [Candidatus Nitrosopelagicus brevis]
MNPKLAVKGINGIIEGGISVTDFAVVTELDEISAKELLYTLVQNGIGAWNDDLVDFDIPHDRLQTALFAITLGATIEDVSEYLTWRDFEAITGIILEENGFDVTKNLVLTKPRMEIDVIGKKMNLALLIDCKHWKTMSKSALDEIVKKQIERVKRYVADEDITALPVIVTLHQEGTQLVENVPIVPIMKLPSFLDEFVGNLGSLKSIEK